MRCINFLLVIIALGIIASSCNKEESAPFDFHYDYFNNNEGQFVIYDVMKIEHSTGVLGHDTSEYQLKTVVGEPYEDNEGRLGNKFYRYIRESATADWELKDVYVTIIVDYKAEIVEENQRIIKLVFKPTSTKVWDANAFNNYDELECYYTDLHKSYTVGNNDFDSTLTVEQEDELNLIEYKRKYEVYANNVGLVKKHFQDLRIQNFDVNDVEEGHELFMDAIEYGYE